MENLNTVKHWKPLCPLTGNGFFYGRIGCLDEDTKIDVVEDYFVKERKLKDLPKKFTVLSLCKETGRRKHASAIKINSGKKECYRIQFRIKSIIASEDHVFFDKDFNEVKVKDLKAGMKLKTKVKIKPYLIRKIEKVGKRKTYDLHVPEYNNFFLSNGILSHNSGKSFKMKALCEYYYERNYKIWDMFGGKRGEGPFWCFPSDELKMWREYEKEVGMMKTYGPKEYNVNIIYPMFSEELPNELPQKKPRISSKLMTIYFKDITIQDISYVIGAASSNAKYVWNYIVRTLPDTACGQDILELFEDLKFKKYKELGIYKNFIKPLCDNRILVGKDNKYLLNIKEEATDRKSIFVLNDDYIPNSFKFFIMGFLIRNLFDLVKKDQIHKYNIALFREMSLFMKVVDSINQDEQQIQNFRNLISDIARYARSGLYIFGDTQSPCLDENTEIYHIINNEIMVSKINELPEKFNVFSYNFLEKKFEVKEGVKKIIGKKEALNLDFGSSNIIATPEHRFFTKNDEEIPTKELKVGDELLSFNIPANEIYRRIKIRDSMVGKNKDKKVSNKTRKKISINTRKAMKNPLIRGKIRENL